MHSVFVSSTFIDLQEHRDAVQRAIKQLGAVDISMENFGARDERPKSECLRIIAQECDTFVGIYAHRYGFVPKGDTQSITESEYDAAGQHNLRRLIYLVNEDVPWTPRFIDKGTAAKKLVRFKKRLRASHICKPFATKDELASYVAADLGRHFLRSTLRRVAPGGDSAYSQAKPNGPLSPKEWNAVPAIEAAAVGGRLTGPWTPEEWSRHRFGKYKYNRDVFLVHSLAPSMKEGQLFDIFIYLQRHKSADFSDITRADFFLGPYWGNQVFSIPNEGGHIGITTSAYGAFLCLCHVAFSDGTGIFLDRYIDFAEYAQSEA